MRRLAIVLVFLCGTGVCLAQDSSGELMGFYQRIQPFTFNSGDPTFNVQKAGVNGFGYAIGYNLSDKYSLFQQMGMHLGVEQNGFKIRMITELQGMKVRTQKGPFDLYAKGGLGVMFYSFSGNFGSGGGSTKLALNYGGGTEVQVSEGLFLVLEATRLTAGLPQLTISPDRSKWVNAWMITTGFAIHF